MYNQLLSFATAENLIIPGETKVFTMYQDNPFITNAKNLRASVAMTIPSDIVINKAGDINVLRIIGKSGIGHFEIPAMEYEAAWQYMYQEWLFKGEEKPKDSFPFEIYVTEPPKPIEREKFNRHLYSNRVILK